eukprot:TRINITY_DN26631_c3_g1_i1.p2 TRINITY_DN26631_c3_g1~~TRINITY_DN26631_c3_g1_i1.p2  ORF type:complete len:160 (-),score=29.98 TRINITY_DN26631_c3_g1_i1:138-617(-)
MFGGPFGLKLPSIQHIGETAAVANYAQSSKAEEKPQAHDLQVWAQMIKEVVRDELSVAATTAQSAAARPMQFIINNSTQANVSQNVESTTPPPQQVPSQNEEGLKSFLAKPLNRFCIFAAVGIGLYMLQGHLSHKWRMLEMQKRIDADIFLRFKRMMAP